MKPRSRVALHEREGLSPSHWQAPVSILAGSLVTLLPIIAILGVLPPFGLMMLVAWRLRRADALPVWAAAPLGLFDDLVSGQPIGSAVTIWTLCVLAIDVINTRLVWREFWHDWLIAIGALSGALVAGRLIASPIGAHVDTVLLFQIALSITLYPVVAQLCTRIDSRQARG